MILDTIPNPPTFNNDSYGTSFLNIFNVVAVPPPDKAKGITFLSNLTILSLCPGNLLMTQSFNPSEIIDHKAITEPKIKLSLILSPNRM